MSKLVPKQWRMPDLVKKADRSVNRAFWKLLSFLWPGVSQCCGCYDEFCCRHGGNNCAGIEW